MFQRRMDCGGMDARGCDSIRDFWKGGQSILLLEK